MRLNTISKKAGIILILSLVLLGLVYQFPFTYRLELGQNESEWAVVSGFGDSEHNEHFSFRWTTYEEAKLLLPEVGWPNQVGLFGLAPRSDGKEPFVTVSAGKPTTFQFSANNASLPPDEYGRLTFEVQGPPLGLKLTPDSLLIGSDLFQSPGDPRSLGVLVSAVYIRPQPGRFGLIVPPLSAWLGWSGLVTLLYLVFNSAGRRLSIKKVKVSQHYFFKQRTVYGFPWIMAGICLLLIVLLRLLLPEWFALNGANVAWGTVLPLAAFLCNEQFFSQARLRSRAVIFFGLLVFGVLMVFWSLALGSFTLTLFIVTGGLLLTLVIQHKFSNHWENTGLLFSLSVGIGWGLWQGRLPRTDDLSKHYIYWVNELDRMIRQGNLYPRWAPDFCWQQGGPVFNYYPPLSRYVAESAHLLGMTFNNSMLLTQYLAVILGTLGCYFWTLELVRDRSSAILGGLAFCYYPYHLAEIYSVGGLANGLAGGILPWVFWLLTRHIRQPRNFFLPIGLGLSGATLALTNNPQLILLVFVGGLYLLGLILIQVLAGYSEWWCWLRGLLIAGIIAFSLSAFFLLPATLGSNQVTLATAGADLRSTSGFYAGWPNTLITLWQPVHPLLLEYSLFGSLPLWLALAGLLMLFYQRNSSRPYLLLLTGLTVLLIFLMYPISQPFWETFKVLTAIQFSYRLNNPIIVFIAPLIAGLAVSFKLRWVTTLTGLAAFGLLLYACFNSFTVTYWPASFNGLISQKALTEQIVSADVLYLPKGLSNPGEVSKYRPPIFEDNRPLSSADQLSWKITGSDSYELKAQVSRPATVTVPLFWYEGWWKITDQQGKEYPNTATTHTRLVTFNLLPGEYAITVRLQDTPLMFLGNWLSILSLLLLLIYFVFLGITKGNERRKIS